MSVKIAIISFFLSYFHFFYPLKDAGGWYAGAGIGVMFATYEFPEGEINENTFDVDLSTGVIIKKISRRGAEAQRKKKEKGEWLGKKEWYYIQSTDRDSASSAGLISLSLVTITAARLLAVAQRKASARDME